MGEENQGADPEEGAQPEARTRNPVRRLYEWVLSWAESRHSTKAMAALAYTEAIFFPVPADILLIVLCLGKPRRSFKFSTITVLFSILGGLTAMLLGLMIGKDSVIAAMETVHLGEKARLALELLNEHGFWAVAIAALTPVPYLAFSWLAGFAGISIWKFIAASLVFRTLRFFSEGAIIYFLGERAERLIDRYFNIASIIVMVVIIAVVIGMRALAHMFGP
ncbi:MAG: hypothetical protein QF662_00700 [Phycisphaerae bacterium]|jgi:membrane protein YqaA with SNARE-associated domain|nr:hypothetical protein [Phycisphaerae bacterium]